ncbi:hypothetical protein IE077_003940, partial [Cardiosporidium cionae]
AQLPDSLTQNFSSILNGALSCLSQPALPEVVLSEESNSSTSMTGELSSSDDSASSPLSKDLFLFLHTSTHTPSFKGKDLLTHQNGRASSSEIISSNELPVVELLQAIDTQFQKQSLPEYQGIFVHRSVLEPLYIVLKKYEKGLIFSAADQIVDLLYHYIEVEEFFHSTIDQAAKVLQSKRTEYDIPKLILLARSHQNLKEKNKIIAKMLDYIRCSPVWQTSRFFQAYLRTYAAFMENLPSLHDALYRISCLSKPEYCTVAFRARQLLLTKKEKPFAQRTASLVGRLLEYSERRSGGVTPLLSTSGSGGINAFVNDILGCADDSLLELFVHSNFKIQKLAIDIYIRRYYDWQGVHEVLFHTEGESWIYDEAPFVSSSPSSPDALWPKKSVDFDSTPVDTLFRILPPLPFAHSPVASLLSPPHEPSSSFLISSSPSFIASVASPFQPSAHPNTGNAIYASMSTSSPTQKESASSSISTHPLAPPTSVEDVYKQQYCSLLAVWTHHALFHKDFLNESTDCLKEDCQTSFKSFPSSSDKTVPLAFPTKLPSSVMDKDASLAISLAFEEKSKSSYSLDGNEVELLGSSSKLHHMLRAFGGSSEAVEYGTIGKSQQTIAIAFSTMLEFQMKFGNCLLEYARLNKAMPPSPPAIDCKILMIFIASIDEESNESTVFSKNSIPSSLRQELQNQSQLLTENSFFLICISYLLRSPGNTVHTSNIAGKNQEVTNESSNDFLYEEFEMASIHMPRCVYFRCQVHIPLNFSMNSHQNSSFSSEFLPSMDSSSELRMGFDSSDIQKTISLHSDEQKERFQSNNAHSRFMEASETFFCEENLLRNVNICYFSLLELKRFCNFSVKVISTSLPQIHMYEAVPHTQGLTTSTLLSKKSPSTLHSSPSVGFHKRGEAMNGPPVLPLVSGGQHSLRSAAPRYFVRIILHHPPSALSEDIFSEQE